MKSGSNEKPKRKPFTWKGWLAFAIASASISQLIRPDFKLWAIVFMIMFFVSISEMIYVIRHRHDKEPPTGIFDRRFVKVFTVLVVTFFVYFMGQIMYVVFGDDSTASDASTAQVQQSREQTYTQATPAELFHLVNKEREKVGVAPLVIDSALMTSAQQKADDMATYHYFDHPNHDGSQGYELAFNTTKSEGVSCRTASENIYEGWGSKITAHAAVESWMNSQSHRDAILNADYSLTGFGVSQDGEKILAVEHFCKQ